MSLPPELIRQLVGVLGSLQQQRVANPANNEARVHSVEVRTDSGKTEIKQATLPQLIATLDDSIKDLISVIEDDLAPCMLTLGKAIKQERKKKRSNKVSVQ